MDHSSNPYPAARPPDLRHTHGRSWLHLDDRSRPSLLVPAVSGPDAPQDAARPVDAADAAAGKKPADAYRGGPRGSLGMEGQGQAEVPAPLEVAGRRASGYLEDASSSAPTSRRAHRATSNDSPRSPAYSSFSAARHHHDQDPHGHDAYIYDPNLVDTPLETPPSEPSAEAAVAEDAAVDALPVVEARTQRQRHYQLFQLVQTHFWFMPLAIFGTLARLGLTALTSYPGSPLEGVIWANFVGCAVMGFLIEDRKLFAFAPTSSQSEKAPSSSSPAPSKTTMPLYMGLTTGFCGSLTSFSSFQLGAFDALANVSPAYTRSSKGYAFCAVAAVLIATLALSYAGLQFGVHLAQLLHPVLPSLPPRARLALDWAAVPLGAGCWAGAAAMAAVIPEWRGVALFACVFAPLGVYVRFWVGRWCNPLVKAFPLGTFAVNVAGSLLLAGLAVGRSEHPAGMGCQLLRGLEDGFCGCLTTVSTLMVELRGLESMFPSLVHWCHVE